MKVALVIVGIIVLDVIAIAVIMRFLKHPAGRWHVDPLTAASPATPNSYRLAPAGASVDSDGEAPVFAVPSMRLAEVFDRVARADARVTVIDGSSADGHITYLQQSAVFAFPDYISVRFVEVDADRSTFAVFSRARIGKSDLGVNKKRLDRWLDGISKQLESDARP